MSEDNNTVQISIYGQEYSVKAPADADYIKKVAAYLDEKMIEVQSGFSTTQSSTRIAILAAMNITDELFTARRNQDSGEGEIDEDFYFNRVDRRFAIRFLLKSSCIITPLFQEKMYLIMSMTSLLGRVQDVKNNNIQPGLVKDSYR